MLTLATCLSKTHDVSIFWNPRDEKTIKETALKKLGIDISNIPFKKNIFDKHVSFANRFIASKNYDAIMVLSDGSIPFLWTNTYIHFQNPVEWVKPSRKTKLKLSRVKKIICNSLFTKSFIDKTFGVTSMVIYPPVSLIEKHVTKENVILNVGRFGINWQGSSFKKQDVLVGVFKKMVDHGLKDWRLMLVLGIKEKDDALESLKKSAKGYPIDLIINPDNDMLWQQYHKAKIYWHAAGFGENLEKYPDRAEHFGIATVEAMGCSAVPVVIHAGGQTEIVEDGKNGFLWQTKEELIKKTLQLTEKKNLWQELSNRAKERVKDFSAERFCREVNEMF